MKDRIDEVKLILDEAVEEAVEELDAGERVEIYRWLMSSCDRAMDDVMGPILAEREETSARRDAEAQGSGAANQWLDPPIPWAAYEGQAVLVKLDPAAMAVGDPDVEYYDDPVAVMVYQNKLKTTLGHVRLEHECVVAWRAIETDHRSPMHRSTDPPNSESTS